MYTTVYLAPSDIHAVRGYFASENPGGKARLRFFLPFFAADFRYEGKTRKYPSPVRSFASERFGYRSAVRARAHAVIPFALSVRIHARYLEDARRDRCSLSRASVSISTGEAGRVGGAKSSGHVPPFMNEPPG